MSNIIDQLHEWDEFSDHAWLGTDKMGHVALFTCSVARVLPNVSISMYDLLDIESEINQLSVTTDRNHVNTNEFHRIKKNIRSDFLEFIDSIAKRGLYYYIFPANFPESNFYRCIVIPQNPRKIADLSDKLSRVAISFKIGSFDFGLDLIPITVFKL
jgi:hypothetical protein